MANKCKGAHCDENERSDREKRDGQALTTEEIRYVVDGYTRGEIPDYQMSAMLMAIYFAAWIGARRWI